MIKLIFPIILFFLMGWSNAFCDCKQAYEMARDRYNHRCKEKYDTITCLSGGGGNIISSLYLEFKIIRDSRKANEMNKMLLLLEEIETNKDLAPTMDYLHRKTSIGRNKLKEFVSEMNRQNLLCETYDFPLNIKEVIKYIKRVL